MWDPCKLLKVSGVPYGSRTRVAAVKGRCPRPLDERDALCGLSRSRRTRYVSVSENTLSNAPLCCALVDSIRAAAVFEDVTPEL